MKYYLLIPFFLLSVCFVVAQDNTQTLDPKQAQLEHALKMPIQSDVDIDIPSEDEAKLCSLVISDDKRGWNLLNAQKQVIRFFADMDGDAQHRIDQWSYYDNGIEVYRELDTNGNGKRDQYRWLNTAGTRWGVDQNEDGAIDYWKEISAQEISREIVLAIASEDEQRFLRATLNADELKGLELGEELNAVVSNKISKLKAGFAEAIAATNFKSGNKVEWYQFNATMPNVVPKGNQGIGQDLTVYENASATVGDGDIGKQIAIGTLVQIGTNNWRAIDVPRIYDENHPLFTFVLPVGAHNSTGPAESEVVTLMNQIQMLQNEVQTLPEAQRPAKHKQIIALLLEIIKNSTTMDERENWIRQLADTIMDATGRNEYPDGKDQIAKLFNSVNKQGKEELAAHVKSRQIMTDYYVALSQKDGNQMEAYSAWLEQLADLCDTFPQTEAGLEGMIQLASYKEMSEGTNEDSLKWYTKAATGDNKMLAKRAKGAIRRLTSEEKAVPFTATDTAGAPFNVAELAGKMVLLVFYDARAVEQISLIKSVTDKFESKGLVPIGVNLNEEKPEERAGGWRTLSSPNGLDGEPATYWGIITPPYMILYGKDGKVTRSNIATAEELQQVLGDLTQ